MSCNNVNTTGGTSPGTSDIDFFLAVAKGDFTGFEDAVAKLNKLEQRTYNTLKMGKDLGMNTEEQNKQLEELEKKKNEASLITGLEIGRASCRERV